MRKDLSSQIKLESIPRRYYNPESEIEDAALRREDKINVRIFENMPDGAAFLASEIARYMKRYLDMKGKCVIALGSGLNTHPVYAELIKMYNEGKVSFENVIVFNISEFFPLNPEGPSTMTRMRDVFLNYINIKPENIHTINPQVTKETMQEYCHAYEMAIEAEGGIDIALCEIAPDGSIAYNGPGSQASSYTRLVLLGQNTRRRIAKEFKCDEAPKTAITLGISNLVSARRMLTMAWGENSAEVIRRTVEENATPSCPASLLQGHPHVKVITDLAGAEDLTRIAKPWLVTSCEWDNKLIRRAIVWLCEVTGKPILKLTNKDYNDHGLGELLAIYGSAYNVNIKIFNDLQHTITGWPGGKPDADDTFRPERSKPYPKRVIVFSPHPDDDVISMGGTLKRLVDQHHDVHVAYETSGNIAVGDEDMMRYFLMMDKIAPLFGFDTPGYEKLTTEVKDFVDHKKSGDVDSKEIREIKTMIRQAEATIACHYIGVKNDHIHFLRLPFYETGTIKKGELEQRDVDIVKKLLAEVKPHEIFVAGDLSDPHGTHKVCTDAVLAAVDEMKDEPWMADCRIWMYRGAWAEWEIAHIEMAVPISPEELRFKRNSILKHQSQMENAPFLGDDDRLFWQRAEDRNRATAKLYQALGLASYEAIEAFVEYKPL